MGSVLWDVLPYFVALVGVVGTVAIGVALLALVLNLALKRFERRDVW